MASKPVKAKLFNNGGSQAVRLPAQYRFENRKEVYVRRDQVSGDVVLSPTAPRDAWSDFFAVRDSASVPRDFLNERPLNRPLQGPPDLETSRGES